MPSIDAMNAAATAASEPGQRYAIGALAKEFGVSPRSLRFYEEQGLLNPERRGTRRLFDHRDRARLALICRGKRLGFSLEEIREFLDLYEVDPSLAQQMRYLRDKAAERRRKLTEQRADIDQTLGELDQILAEIDRHLSVRETGT